MRPYDKEKHKRWELHRAPIDARMAASRPATPQALLARLASPEPFRAWLETKAPHTPVGNEQTPDDAVLANYIWETMGVYVLVAGLTLYGLDRLMLDLPAWCIEFYHREVEHKKASSPPNGEWTASEALTMLDEALQRLNNA